MSFSYTPVRVEMLADRTLIALPAVMGMGRPTWIVFLPFKRLEDGRSMQSGVAAWVQPHNVESPRPNKGG